MTFLISQATKQGAHQMAYYVIDSFGRSYYEGQTFPDRDAAIAAEHDRPHGAWIAAEDEDDVGEEIIPPARGLPSAVTKDQQLRFAEIVATGQLITVRIPTGWAESWWGVPQNDPDAAGHERPAFLWKDARYSSESASGVHVKVYRSKLDAIDDRGGIDCLLPPGDCDLT